MERRQVWTACCSVQNSRLKTPNLSSHSLGLAPFANTPSHWSGTLWGFRWPPFLTMGSSRSRLLCKSTDCSSRGRRFWSHTHMAAHDLLQFPRGSDALSWPQWAPGTQYTYVHRQNTHAHKNKPFKKLREKKSKLLLTHWLVYL